MPGLTPFQGFLASLFNNASAGEYAAFTLIAAERVLPWSCPDYADFKCALPFNELCLSAAFCTGHPIFSPAFHAYDVTDELFGITIARPGYLNPFYTYGAIALAAPAWSLGTAFGILAGNILPARIVSALSVALYGMFLAIIIPPARKDKVVAVLVILSFVLSFACGHLPVISDLSGGTRTIVLTVAISSVAAILFPVNAQQADDSAS